MLDALGPVRIRRVLHYNKAASEAQPATCPQHINSLIVCQSVHIIDGRAEQRMASGSG
jgi:hypothetical protein